MVATVPAKKELRAAAASADQYHVDGWIRQRLAWSRFESRARDADCALRHAQCAFVVLAHVDKTGAPRDAMLGFLRRDFFDARGVAHARRIAP